ncbi:MAG: penicillin-binding protein 1A [Rhodothermales bacterium]
MSKQSYSQAELNEYFQGSKTRRRTGGDGASTGGRPPRPRPGKRPSKGWSGFFYNRIDNPKRAQAASVLAALGLAVVTIGLCVVLYLGFLMVAGDTPSTQAIENPALDLATVAYTADGEMLARYARQNRSWASFDEISPHVIEALVSTEDHRFERHWGVDMEGILAAIADIFRKGDLRGASTITQQLARNLYDEQIGRDVTPTRKLKEMVTAIQLERNYTKREIIEMYLNTVEFGSNAFGIQAAAFTFYGKDASELDLNQSATLVGMLQAISRYNPIRNPTWSGERRNIVLSNMLRAGFISRAEYKETSAELVETDYHSAELDASLAPYFAEHVRNWMRTWSQENGRDFYAEGLVVYTTIDSRMQEMAQEAVDRQMKGLQAVVDYEWSQGNGYRLLAQETGPYLQQTGYEPFEYFWESKPHIEVQFIQETDHYKELREGGMERPEALDRLRRDAAFMDSLKAEKTRLEAGLLALDPRTGYVKAWVGGTDFEKDKYDHVDIAKRQAGSTFKPFTYTVAIDNGYSPSYMLMDSSFTYVDPKTGKEWTPGNSSGGSTGEMMTLRDALANSVNTVSARLIAEVTPRNVAFYAHRMGIQSPLEEVASLALGTSNVTLYEMTAAYVTLADGGLYREPTVVTRIEDRMGNVLYEAQPDVSDALSESTAYTVVDMMRGNIDYGTGQRIRWQFGIGTEYDLAGKTGTTQNSADNWFMMLHPDLVTGSWVGFNDPRVSFRTNFWGQGAHSALFLVGDFFRQLTRGEDLGISDEVVFPTPETLEDAYGNPVVVDSLQRGKDDKKARGKVGW